MNTLDTTADRTADRIAILALNDGLRAAWNAHDAAAFIAPWADDADHVNVFGAVLVGRAAIEKAVAFIHAGPMARSRSEVVVRDLRFAADDVAILDLEQTLTGVGGPPGAPQPPWHHGDTMQSMIKIVLKKAGGTWTVASFQNTAITPMR